jgi:membrane protein
MPLISDLKETFRRWNDNKASLMAAGVAYYGALSFFPLLLTLISGVGLILQFTAAGQNAEQQLLEAVGNQMSAQLQQQIASALDQVRSGANTGGPLGLITLLFGAMAIFVQLDSAFDVIWDVEPQKSKGILAAVRRVVFQRGVAFIMLLALGLILMVVQVAGITVTAVANMTDTILPGSARLWNYAKILLPLVLNSAIFTLIYRLLPKAPVTWKQAVHGGLFAGIVWEIGRQVLTHFLVGTKYSNAYGVVGSFIAVMLWIYYAVAVLFLGAQYGQSICTRDQNDDQASKARDTDSSSTSMAKGLRR